MKGQTERTGNPEVSHHWGHFCPWGWKDRQREDGDTRAQEQDHRGCQKHDWMATTVGDVTQSRREVGESWLLPPPPFSTSHWLDPHEYQWAREPGKQAQCLWYRAEDGKDRGARGCCGQTRNTDCFACILNHRMASLVAQRVKNLPANAGDPGKIPRLGRSPEKGMATHSRILSCLENAVGRGSWWATAHGVTKSQTWLSD